MAATEAIDVTSRAAERAGGRRHAPRFGDLPLSWKLLLPSIALMVILGIVGGYLIVRDLSSRSAATLELELSRRALEVRASLRDAELSLVEAANFAANLEGMAAAVAAGDERSVARLLESVVALKTDLHVFAATRASGRAIVEFARDGAPGTARRAGGTDWGSLAFVRAALADAAGAKHSGLTSRGEQSVLALAAPVCSARAPCAPAGAAVVGFDLAEFASRIHARLEASGQPRAGFALFDGSGTRIAGAGAHAPERVAGPFGGSRTVGVPEVSGGVPVVTLYAPFETSDARLGTLALSIPAEETLAAVRRTGVGLGLVLLAAMAGIAIIGVLLSRLTVRRVRALVATNRALGRGDLAARAHVDWNDEIGELGSRLNEMAEQLQAMYESLELRVAQRTDEVERLLRERTEFFASVSHELRTPLAVILRHAEMLLDDAYRKDRRWRAEAGSALRDSGGQLANLIDDILELAEVEAASLQVALEPVDVYALVRESRGTIEPLARASGVKAAVRVPAGRCVVAADPRRLRQILINLADNAVKYTPEGGKVEVAVRCDGAVVSVSVSDTGVGIPAEAGERIFEPFFRASGTKPQQGQSSSGLGLAVARRLVEAHAGRIAYEPRDGGGTTFTFTLPREPVPATTSGGRDGDDA